jgi:hypothetical protein
LRKRADGTEERLIEQPHPNGGTVITLAPEEPVMPNIDMSKAAPLWSAYVDLIAKREGVTMSKAIDVALSDPTGKELFDIVREHNLQKMGNDGSWPGGPTHGNTMPDDPHRTQRHDVGAGSNDPAWKRYQAAIKKHMASGMKMSAALDQARREMSETDWSTIKAMSVADVHIPSATPHPNNPPILNGPGRSPTMLPLSNDANALPMRGPYQSGYAQAAPSHRRGI